MSREGILSNILIEKGIEVMQHMDYNDILSRLLNPCSNEWSNFVKIFGGGGGAKLEPIFRNQGEMTEETEKRAI